MRCHSVCAIRSPSFRYDVLVASERVVTVFPFGVVLVSASLPRKPMSSTRLRYMSYLLFVPICLGRPKLSGRHSQDPREASGQPTEVDFLGADRRGKPKPKGLRIQ